MRGPNSQVDGPVGRDLQRRRRSSRAAPVRARIKPNFTTSNVVMNSQMFGAPDARSVGRGATLAMQCAICHGSNRHQPGRHAQPRGPDAAAIYKQLRDFKAGARTNAIMAPFAVKLERAGHARSRRLLLLSAAPARRASRSAAAGAADRRQRCADAQRPALRLLPWRPRHQGRQRPGWRDSPPSTSRRNSQAFATGTRHNDISEQMRNIARQMTAAEIDEAARYYASRP